MLKKMFSTHVPFVSIGIFSPFIACVIGIWLYAAHCFEKNIIYIHDILLKTGHVTTDDVHIKKYKLQASFKKPVIKFPIEGVDLAYIGGDRLNINYNILTKTLTVQAEGDELFTLNKDNDPINLVTISKKDGKNNNRFSIRFAKFFPEISEQNEQNNDYPKKMTHIIKNIKSLRVFSENCDVAIKNLGTFSAKRIKFTSEPRIQKDTVNSVALHLHDRYTFDEMNFVGNKDNLYPLNTASLPKLTAAHSHMVISLGDKSQATTYKILNEFHASKNWKKLLEELTAENKSEGKQVFEGLLRDWHSNVTYSGPNKTTSLHIDLNDTYDAKWKQEYLGLLQMITTLFNISSEKKEPLTDEKLMSLLPDIENYNPIKKTADINVTMDNAHINTKISLGYDSARHGATVKLDIPFKKNAFDDIFKKINNFFDQELETFVDQSITAKLVLKNSDALLDDIESILLRCQKTVNNSMIFGDLIGNKKLIKILLSSFGRKIDTNQLNIQLSYDTILKKFNYDTASNIGDIVTKILPMFLSSGSGHDDLIHDRSQENRLVNHDTTHTESASETISAQRTVTRSTSY